MITDSEAGESGVLEPPPPVKREAGLHCCFVGAFDLDFDFSFPLRGQFIVLTVYHITATCRLDRHMHRLSRPTAF